MSEKRFKNYSKKEKEDTDLGFGTKNQNTYRRFLNKDGSVNIIRRSSRFLNSIDIFHSLITMRTGKFIFLVLSFYVAVNLVFALLFYFVAGPEGFGNLKTGTETDHFFQLFFFSTQTLTTVGYGYVYPVSHLASTLSAIESLFGLLGFALATGILYGRFSRPKAEILFSKNMVLAPYRGITALMFRIVNMKQNELIELDAQVIVSMKDLKNNTRLFLPLTLERKNLSFLALTWTIVHPIDENSPLAFKSHQDLIDADAEFIIVIKAINDTYSQSVYSRSSYKADEILWAQKFSTMTQKPAGNGKVILDIEEVDKTEVAELPVEVFA